MIQKSTMGGDTQIKKNEFIKLIYRKKEEHLWLQLH